MQAIAESPTVRGLTATRPGTPTAIRNDTVGTGCGPSAGPRHPPVRFWKCRLLLAQAPRETVQHRWRSPPALAMPELRESRSASSLGAPRPVAIPTAITLLSSHLGHGPRPAPTPPAWGQHCPLDQQASPASYTPAAQSSEDQGALVRGAKERGEVTGTGQSGRAGPGREAGCGMDVAQARRMEAGTNPAPSAVLGKFPHQTKIYDERRLAIFDQ